MDIKAISSHLLRLEDIRQERQKYLARARAIGNPGYIEQADRDLMETCKEIKRLEGLKRESIEKGLRNRQSITD